MADVALVAPTTARGRRRPARWAATAAILAALAAVPWVAIALGQDAFVTMATRMVILAIAATSLNLALGYGGMVSFGHAAFYGLGGYAVGILTTQAAAGELLFGTVPGTDQLLLTLPAALIVGGVAALLIGALSLRTSGVQFIMITLAFAQMLFFLFVSLKTYGGDDGLIMRRRNALPGLNMRDDTTFYLVCLTVGALYLGLLARLVDSRFGFVLGGIRQNRRRMASIGVSPYRYQLTAFAISGAGAALAGGLMANLGKFVSPDMLHWTQSGELMVMVILGGVGTLLGPALGAVLLIGLESALAAWTEHWQAIFGPLLLLVVLFASGGLLGGWRALAAWARRR